MISFTSQIKTTTFLTLLTFSGVSGQNYVPNPSFEELNDTIGHFTESYTEFNEKIKFWESPNTASPDIITQDFKERYITPSSAHSGSVMVGIQAKQRWSEYLSIDLTETLSPNRTYYVEFWMRRAHCLNPKRNMDEKMNDRFGILFTRKDLKTEDPKMFYGRPQVAVGTDKVVTDTAWVRIAQYYTPYTEFNKLYLGQFRKDDADFVRIKNYYQIDDITVRALQGQEDLEKDVPLPVGSIIPLNNVLFISGGVKLKDKQSNDILNGLVAFLKANPEIRVRINGHTDSVGRDKTNMKLSKKRAKFIKKYIISAGIHKNRIEYQGYGEKKPVADNETKVGRSKNRRVEFEIIK